MSNLLEPWVLLRMISGLVAFALFARGALTAQRVLRKFEVARATEGQLALERQMELASTFVRVGAVVQVLALVLSALSSDRLSRGVRGAMCAYGVFAANEWGFRSLASTIVVAVAAGVLTQVLAFDARVRSFALARPIAGMILAMAPLSLVDLSFAYEFLSRLDLTAVASCCSVRLDPVAASGASFAGGPRVAATAIAVLGTISSIASALFAARAPTARRVEAAGVVSLASLPAAIMAAILEVAPHAFEVPQHVCPFCLLRGDVLAIGYPLFGALFLAAVWSGGAATSALLCRPDAARSALADFARHRLLRGAAAWGVALVVAAAPVVRFAVVSGGASLFP